MNRGRRVSGKRFVSLVFSAALIVLAGWVFLNRQMLQDEIILARYQPPAEIAALAKNAKLSERGKDLFFVSQPELHGKSTFSKVCHGLGDEQSNVLGCFTGNNIYIFNVVDEELRGVREVTAAHEMLHAAYARLSSNEKQHVDSLIQRQLRQHVEPHIDELIAIYNRLEPGQLNNEMHSILATEQDKLLPELEEYYSIYFENRKGVVVLSDAYREVFESYRREQEALVRELDQLASTINSDTAALNRRIDAYNQDVEQFNSRARSGEITEAEFNQERAELEVESQSINAAIASNDALRDKYDQKRSRYESLAVEVTELKNSIDSRPARPEGVR